MADLTWRPRVDGRTQAQAKKPSDILAVGDVIHVKAIEKDGAFQNWSLRHFHINTVCLTAPHRRHVSLGRLSSRLSMHRPWTVGIPHRRS